MKKLICALIALIVVAACAFGGCGGLSGADGNDGRDLNIYDIYEAANNARAEEGQEQLSFLEFLREYLNYDFEYSDSENLQAVINRSLLSAVAIVTDFSYGYGRSSAHAGAGIIVELDKEKGDAYIVTNAHVVYDSTALPNWAQGVYVYLYGNDDISSEEISVNYAINADIVNYSVSYDLALLKVTNSQILKESDARAAEFSESEQVYAGEKVYTVGNPEGGGISVTSGYISRESEFISLDFAEGTGNVYRVMRTDAGTNGGNSGGGLYDTSGRIVGIINSKDADAENENMSYALCGSYVKRVWKLLRDNPAADGRYGEISYSVFPVEYKYTSEARFNNETNRTEITDTVYVSGSNVNLKTGDKIKHIKITDGSGATVEDLDIIRFFNVDDVLISARSGYTITYTVERNGNLIDVNLNPFIITVGT